MVNPIAAVVNGFKNYANFTGRSTRAEFWWWYLFSIIAYVILGVISALVLPPIPRVVPSNSNLQYQTFETPNLILVSLFSLALLVPTLALVVRRLRDAGYYWAWLFISFVPIIGGIWLLVLYCMPSSSNGWGEPTDVDSGPVPLPRQYY